MSLHEHYKEQINISSQILVPNLAPIFGLAQGNARQLIQKAVKQKQRRAGLALPACNKVNRILQCDRVLCLDLSSGMAA